jgi:hypothetical protein
VPPEGHGPQAPQVPPRRIVDHSLNTEAQATDNGGLIVTVLVSEAGEPVLRSYIIGEPGRKAIQDAANGGIEIAHAGEMPKADQ